MGLIILYFLGALSLSFLCSVLEAVLLSTPMSFISMKENQGSKTASLMKQYKNNVDRPVGAILSLNTIAHTIGSAGVGAESMKLFGEEYFGIISAILTLLILVLSEIIPKTIGASYWRSLAMTSTKIIRVLIFITYPLVLLSELITKVFTPKNHQASVSLGIEAAKEEIERLHAQIDSDGFWDNQEVSQKVMKQSRLLESKVELYERMCSQWDDLYTLCEMAIEEGDDSMLPELTEGYAQLEQEMEKARLETLLSGEYDNNNAIVSFQAGAGGTEAQDWASMLYRMYTHWTEQHGLSYKILDYLDGDEAGIKSASILIEGENAYSRFLILIFYQTFGDISRHHTIFGMKSGRQISCHAVQIYATGRSLRGIHSLRQQSQDHAGQHISAACRSHSAFARGIQIAGSLFLTYHSPRILGNCYGMKSFGQYFRTCGEVVLAL